MTATDISRLHETIRRCWQNEQITPTRARLLEKTLNTGQAHGDLQKLLSVQAELLAAQRLPPIRPDH